MAIPRDAVELIEKRTVHAKTWQDGNQFYVRTSPRPIHYRVGEQWEEINPSWDIVRRGNIRSTGVPHVVQVDTNAAARQFAWAMTASDGAHAAGQLAGVEGVRLSSLPNFNLPDPIVTGHQLQWIDVVPGADILALLSWGGVSWNWIIKDASAPRFIDWEIEEDSDKRLLVDLNIRGTDNVANQDVGRVTENQRVIEVLNPLPTGIDDATTPGKRLYILRSGWTGRVQDIDPTTRIRSWRTDRTVYPIRVDPTIVEDISADADDGSGIPSSGLWEPRGGVLEAGRRTSPGVMDGGLRFRTVDVPQGATITQAIIVVDVVEISTPFSLTVYGDDVDTAPLWSNSSLPSGIAKTTASSDFAPTGTGLYGVEVTAIVQEIVNRGGWAANNDMRFALLSEGAYPSGYHKVSLVDLSTWGTPTSAELEIIYTTGPAVAYEQEGYRWRDDDAASGTFLAAQDTGITRAPDTNTRLRMLVDTSASAASRTFPLEYKEDSEAVGLWRNVGSGLAGAVPTVTLLGSASSGAVDAANISIPVTPSTIAIGDLMVMIVAVDGAITNFAGPASWVAVPGVTNGPPGADDTPHQHVLYKIAVTGDTSASSYTCTWTTLQERAGVILRIPAGQFDAAAPFSIAASSGIVGTTATNLPLAPSVVTTRNNCLIIRAFTADDDDAASENDGTLTLTGGALFDLQPASLGPTLFGGYHSQATAGASGTFQFQLAVGEEWASVTIAVQPPIAAAQVSLAASPHLADGSATSAELTAPASGTFQAGEFHDTTLTTGTIAFDLNEYTEIEWCITANSAVVSNGEVYEFRIPGLDTYSVTPTMEIGAGVGPEFGTGESSGAATATAVGRSVISRVAAASGTGTALAVGQSSHVAVGTSAAAASVSGIGYSSIVGVASSQGLSSVSGIGYANITGAGVGLSQGTSSVAGVGQSRTIASGSASGQSAVIGVGQSLHTGVGVSTGTSVAAAIARGILKGVGSAAGTSSVTGVGVSLATIAYEQEGFRWRDDDAASGSFLASQDTGIIRAADINTRLRMLVDTANAAGSRTFPLEYKEDSEAVELWREIGTAGGGGAGAVPTVTLLGSVQNSQGAPTVSISIPVTAATIAVGDLMVMIVAVGPNISAFAGPSGWAAVPGVTNGPPGTDNVPHQHVLYKIAVSGDTSVSSYTSTWTTSAGNVGVILRIPATEFDAAAPFSIAASSGIVGTTETNSPLAPSVVTTRNNCLIIRAFTADDNDDPSEDDPTLTLTGGFMFDLGPATLGPTVFGGYHSQATAGASGTFLFLLAGAEEWAAVTIAVQPPEGLVAQIELAASPHLADGSATSAELTAPASGSFQAGEFHDTTLTTGTIAFDADEYTEVEWCIIANSAAVSNGEIYQFRIPGLDTYSVTPTMEIGVAPGGPEFGTGQSAGTATVSGAGRAIVAVLASASGESAVLAIGESIYTAVGASAGISSVSGIGYASVAGLASSEGTSSVSGIGQSRSPALASASGQATVAGVGQSTYTAVGSSAGVAVALATGESLSLASASSAGTAVAVAVGRGLSRGVAASAATATVTGIGISVFHAVGESAGASTIVGISQSVSFGVAESSGSATLTAVGRSRAGSVGASAGISIASAFASGSGTGVGVSAGEATVIGVGDSLFHATGASTGESVVIGIGRSLFHAVGESTGTAVAIGDGRLRHTGIAGSSSEATVAGLARAIATSVGSSAGTSTCIAFASGTGSGVGISAGEATASGIGSSQFHAIGELAGTSVATGLGHSTARGIAESSGLTTITGVARAIATAVGSSVGASGSMFFSSGTGTGIAQSDGTATVTGVGHAIVSGLASAQGDASVSGTAHAVSSAVAEASGSTAPSITAHAITTGISAAGGAATVTGVGHAIITSVANSQGASTASAVSQSSGLWIGGAFGSSVAAGVGQSRASTVGNAIGSATVSGQIKGVIRASGSSSGSSSVTALGIIRLRGIATVSAMASVVGTAHAFAYGSAITSGSASASGTLRAIAVLNGVSLGITTASSFGVAVKRGVGSSLGFSIVSGSILDASVGEAKFVFHGTSGDYVFIPSSRDYVFIPSSRDYVFISEEV